MPVSIALPVLLALSASTASSASNPTTSDVARFALVIGNNRSLTDARPDLRYADDDAVRLGRLLRDVGAVHAVVLTRPDATTLVSAGEIAGAPTAAAVNAAAQLLAVAIADARREGRRTSVMIAFAGHGDVEDGKGTLELEDARLLPDDVRALLEDMNADESHLLFDSCNSFFVVHPRRPGGRTFATKRDATGGLTTKQGRPHVFLSTSAEAQVWEWSQLEGGIFSHAVRSGLSGAADADGNGAVTYGELRAFVESAVADIDGEIYRPRLYVSDGSDDAVLLPLRGGRTLTLSGFTGRVTVRDARGTRLLDVHPAPDFSPVLRLSDEHRSGALELSAETQANGRVVLSSLEIAPELELAVIEPAQLTAGNTPRGTSASLQRLFARPFGPAAVATITGAGVHSTDDDASPNDDDVFGLTVAQERRIALQLDVFARDARARRAGLLAAGAIASAATGAYFVATASGAEDPSAWLAPDVLLASAAGTALPIALAAPIALSSSPEERIADVFTLAPHGTQRERMVRASRALEAYDEAAEADGVDRLASAAVLVGGGALITLFGAVLSQSSIDIIVNGEPAGSVPFPELRALGAGVVATGVGLAGAGVTLPLWWTSPRETAQALQRGDPEPLLVMDATP